MSPTNPEDPEADEDYQSYLDFKKQRWEQKHHFDEEPPVMSANPHAQQEYEGYKDYKKRQWDIKHDFGRSTAPVDDPSTGEEDVNERHTTDDDPSSQEDQGSG